MERGVVAAGGRGWLEDTDKAREILIGTNEDLNPMEKSPGVFVPVSLTIFIVAGSVIPAFIIAYYTPTVSLGCHSASYMIFSVLAVFLAVVEIVVG